MSMIYAGELSYFSFKRMNLGLGSLLVLEFHRVSFKCMNLRTTLQLIPQSQAHHDTTRTIH